MQRFIVCILFMLLAGCAHTPTTLKEKSSPVYEGTRAGNWKSTAECVVEGLEKQGQLEVSLRPYDTRHYAEVIVNSGGAVNWLASFSQHGSQVNEKLWFTPAPTLNGITQQEFVAILGKCP